MDFSAIIKKSFEISWHNRVLWLFGFLSGSTTGVSYLNPGNFNGGTYGSDKSSHNTNNVLGVTDRSNDLISQGALTTIIVAISLVAIIILFLVIFVSNWAAGALIYSILQREKERPTFKVGANAGLKYWWRFLLLSLILGLFIAAFVLMLTIPAVLLFLGNLQVLAIIYTVLAIIVFVLSMFVISSIGSLIITISQRMIVHKDTGVLESIRLSGGLIKKYLGESLLSFLVAIGLNFGAGVIFMIVFLPVVIAIGALIFIGFSVPVFLVFGLALAIPIILLLFAASGFWQAFAASYWTLVYEYLIAKEGW